MDIFEGNRPYWDEPIPEPISCAKEITPPTRTEHKYIRHYLKDVIFTINPRNPAKIWHDEIASSFGYGLFKGQLKFIAARYPESGFIERHYKGYFHEPNKK